MCSHFFDRWRHRFHSFGSLFRGIVVAHILYAMPAWGPHLNVAQTSRINSFLKHAYKCGFSKSFSQSNSFCIVQPPVFLIKCTNLPAAFTTFPQQLRHLSTHCIIVRPTLPLSANISCLKCPLLTGVCLVTWKLCINFHYSHCIFLEFCIFPFFCVVLLLFMHVWCIY